MDAQTSPSSKVFWSTAIAKISAWVLATMDPLLLIFHLTIIYIVFLWADNFVLLVISSSFSELIKDAPFVASLLLGIKIFSAVGVAFGYGFHTVYQLVKDARDFITKMKQEFKIPESDNIE